MVAMVRMRQVVAIFPLLFVTKIAAYYVAGQPPHPFNPGEVIPLFVNKIYSDETHLPYAYSDLPFVCPSSPAHHQQALNLGQVLRGDRIIESTIKINSKKQVDCQIWCQKQITEDQSKDVEQLIREDHWVEWIVDDLPGATTYVVPKHTSPDQAAEALQAMEKRYNAGFPLGYIDEKVFLSLLYILKY